MTSGARQLHACIQDSDKKRCKDKALWLISFRDYSRSDLIGKLRRDYSDESCESAVHRLEELGLIDDGRYARRYTADLINLKHLSERGVRQKLYEKGVDRDLIDEVVEEFEFDEKEQIRTIIEKKYARSLNDEKGQRRCANALARLGFSYGDIKSVMREYIEINEE